MSAQKPIKTSDLKSESYQLKAIKETSSPVREIAMLQLEPSKAFQQLVVWCQDRIIFQIETEAILSRCQLYSVRKMYSILSRMSSLWD